ncbi:drug/metabolite transporter (DMT)-like permease [Azospirillum lipoferum]|uniref:DMT family transporter n=1 Tax=Azospirillum lipoferum TaxID=193 RepID=A0A5A9GK73_AZOLI|nr:MULTISPECIES: DMT family transporter [Azospirillum]KAA0594074.1 DMT family transporter [Azospirillum lipoferum]MCP1612564.1 drug/metabolite transporter (DMT)-like permease [Azospirillum lipoferum]MDW5531653.1 DMT family transporter [Azospirillum sp. NL1]
MSGTATGGQTWLRLMPGLFVLLWSTGFIGAKYGLPYVEPLTFLLLRLGLVAVVLALVALVSRAPWPKDWATAGRIALAGLLVHGVYLGGIFIAMAKGLPAGVTALVVGIQPLLTAALSGPLLGERVTGRQWAGLLLGLAGVGLVVREKLAIDAAHLVPLGYALVALVGITLGTLYQKRHGGGMDLRSGTAIQYGATALALAVAAPLTETMRIQWTGEFVFALLWLCFVLSVGAIFLLFALIRRGAAAKVASLFYLTPPVTALIAWILFGEKLGIVALAGMAVAVCGVALVNRK